MSNHFTPTKLSSLDSFRRKIVGFILVSLLGVLICTPMAIAISAKQQIAVQELKDSYPGVEVFTDGIKVKRIFGRAFGSGPSPKSVGDSFCQTFSAVLGTSAENLVPHESSRGSHLLEIMQDRVTGQPKFTMAVYRQELSRIPVFRATLKLIMRNDFNNSLVLASSGVRNLGSFKLDQALAVLDPQSVAESYNDPEFPNPANIFRSETVIWAGMGNETAQPTLAVTFVANDGTPATEAYVYVIEISTGQLLHKESALFHLDIYGNVAGNATEGVANEACANEVSTTLPYARVRSSTDTTYADSVGDYDLTNSGTGFTVVTADLQGRYFQVDNLQGGEINEVRFGIPPGPIDFLLNRRNLAETKQAQVNLYVQANLVRGFVLDYYPSWPDLDDTTFTLYANSTSGDCSHIAWYDPYSSPVSITTCLSSALWENSAMSTVIQHEYGHHVMFAAGNETPSSFHEGMSDVLAIITMDSPAVGLGLEQGNCVDTFRTADNDQQYPCSGGDVHDCIQLASGAFWDTREALKDTYPSTYRDILADLTLGVMLTSTSDDQIITPQITIDMLTLDDDDSDIHNGTPHSDEINEGFALHNMDIPEFSYDTIFVDSATGDDQNSGTAASPKETIQAGIDASSAGNIVMVLPGTYDESIDFDGKEITVRSSRGPLYSRITGSSTDTLVRFCETESHFSSLTGFSLNGGAVGIICDISGPIIKNNILDGQSNYGILANNLASFWTEVSIVNNTIVNSSGKGIWYKYHSIDIRNNIINANTYGVEAYKWEEASKSGTSLARSGYPIEYCDVFGNTMNYRYTGAGTGSISSDPLFYSDFSLKSNSPCIDTGDPDSLYNDSDGSRNDMGALATTHLCGDVNDDQTVDSLDVTYLADFMFYSGPSPIPYASGDVECVPGITISDLVWLVGYVYESGSAPCDCGGGSKISSLGLYANLSTSFGKDHTQVSLQCSVDLLGVQLELSGVTPDDLIRSSECPVPMHFSGTKDGVLIGLLNTEGPSRIVAGDHLLFNIPGDLHVVSAIGITAGNQIIDLSVNKVENHLSLPTEFGLRQNYPNPFNPTTTIAFDLPVASEVSMTVFNTLGQKVATVASGRYEAGTHEITIDTGKWASGVYMYRLKAGQFVETRKMIMVK